MFVSLVVSARPRCKLYPLPLPAHSSCSALDHFSRSSVSARLHWRKSSGQRCSGANHSRPRFDYSKDMRLGTSPHPVHLLRYTLYSYLFFGCLATYSRSRRLALVGLCSFFTLVVHRHGIKEEAVRLLELRTTVARPSLYDRAFGRRVRRARSVHRQSFDCGIVHNYVHVPSEPWIDMPMESSDSSKNSNCQLNVEALGHCFCRTIRRPVLQLLAISGSSVD